MLYAIRPACKLESDLPAGRDARADGPRALPFDTSPRIWHHNQHVAFKLGDRSPQGCRFAELFLRQRVSTYGRVAVSADDQRLIAECLRGEASAFGELVRRHQERLFHTVYRMVNNTEDARDVVQDAFLNAYQSLDSFKGDSLFFTWLYRIAVNTAINLKRKQRVVLSIDATRNGESLIEPADSSEDNRPGHALERVETARRVRDALKPPVAGASGGPGAQGHGRTEVRRHGRRARRARRDHPQSPAPCPAGVAGDSGEG